MELNESTILMTEQVERFGDCENSQVEHKIELYSPTYICTEKLKRISFQHKVPEHLILHQPFNYYFDYSITLTIRMAMNDGTGNFSDTSN
jgi:hypothetical protein